MGKGRMFWIFWRHYMGEDVMEQPVHAPSTAPRVSAPPMNTSRRTMNSRAYYSSSDITSTFSRFGREVFCVLDPDLHCYSLSENWEKISGFSAAEDVGEGLRDRIAPDHLKRVSHYLEKGDDSASARFQIKHADGHWRWCEIQLAEPDARGERFKCLLRDVTHLVVAQGKLEKAKLEADLANKSRSEFLANMSHELRTPLNAILGFAQMIESGTYGDIGHPKYHDYVGSIQESGTTLLSKINDLLEIATIDSGRLELRESETDLCGIIRHAVEFHSHRAFAGQIALTPRLPAEPLIVNVDRIRMLQVITNLLSNAIKYNRPGGAVEIRCDVRKDGGINVVIEDNGGGILPMHLQNILTAFRQDNSFFARSRDCVGLGLALSKEIVKLHQGRIDIDSEPEQGTLLTIRLPSERTVKVPEPVVIEHHIELSAN